MADDEETKNIEEEEVNNEEESTPESKDEKESGGGFLGWIIMAVVILIFAGAGFGIGRLLAGSKESGEAASPQQNEQAVPGEDAVDLSSDEPTKTWYYSLDPVVANLNEPSVTRYVRATLVFEMSSEVDENKGTTFIDEKKPLLTNWLTIFLAGQTIEDIRGDRNLRRIQSQILDTFNEKLFPAARPQIKRILFKEFAIQ